jgi:hypothetical protein
VCASIVSKQSLSPSMALLREKRTVGHQGGLGDRLRQRTQKWVLSSLQKAYNKSRKIKRIIGIIQLRQKRFAISRFREFFYRSEILFAYEECDHYMALVERYDSVMSRNHIGIESIGLIFSLWRLKTCHKKTKLTSLVRILSDTWKRAGIRSLRAVQSKQSSSFAAFRLVDLMDKKIFKINNYSFFEILIFAMKNKIHVIQRNHEMGMMEHERVTRELADAAAVIESEYRELKNKETGLLTQQDLLEKRLAKLSRELERESRENELLLLKVNESMNADMKLREQINSLQSRSVPDIDQYQRMIDQQRAEIENLRSRLADQGKLSNSVAFYKNKCLLQSEQISALQIKLRESTTSPILSTRGGTGSNGVLFPSPVHSMSQDLTYASSSMQRIRNRRTSMGDYTPTGEESSRRNRSYASDRRRF